MRWVLTYVCPPLAVLFCGKPFSALLAAFLTLLGWMPGVRYAQYVLLQHLDNKRAGQITAATNHPEWTKELTKPASLPYNHLPSPGKPKMKAHALVDDPAVGMNGTVFRRKSQN